MKLVMQLFLSVPSDNILVFKFHEKKKFINLANYCVFNAKLMLG